MTWTAQASAAAFTPVASGSGVITLPAAWTGRAANDLIVVHVTVRGTAPIVMPTFGAGTNEWVELYSNVAVSNTLVNNSGGTSGAGGAAFMLIRGASDPTNLTISRGSGTDGGMAATITVYRNAVPGVPVYDTGFLYTTTAVSGAIATGQSMTVQDAGSIVIGCFHCARASTASSWTATNWFDTTTNIFSSQTTTTGADMSVQLAHGDAPSAGTVGPLTVSVSQAAINLISLIAFRSETAPDGVETTTDVDAYSYSATFNNVGSATTFKTDAATGYYELTFYDVVSSSALNTSTSVSAYSYAATFQNVGSRTDTKTTVSPYAYTVAFQNVASKTATKTAVTPYSYAVTFYSVGSSTIAVGTTSVNPYAYVLTFNDVGSTTTEAPTTTGGHPVHRRQRRRRKLRADLVPTVPGINAPLSGPASGGSAYVIQPMDLGFNPLDPSFQYIDPMQQLAEIAHMQKLYSDEEALAMILLAK